MPAAVLIPALSAAGVPVGELILDQVRTRLAGVELQVDRATVGAKIAETMSGVATLTVDVHDPRNLITKSGVLGRQPNAPKRFRDIASERRGYARLGAIDLRTGEVWWRLDSLQRQDQASSLVFEDRVAPLMREHDAPRRWSRSHFTRAQAVHATVREVKAMIIPFICPDEAVRQRIAKPDAPTEDTTALDVKSGFAPGAQITVKHVRADVHQRRVLDDILRAGRDMNVTRRMMIGAVMCTTQEAVAREIHHGDAAGPDSRGPFQQRTSWGTERDRVRAYTAAKKFYGAWIGTFGKHATGDLDAMITKVQVSVGGYGDWEDEATETVDAWTGETAGEATSSQGKQFVFQRGEPGKGRENSWDFSGRMATDPVEWNRFAIANALVFSSDQTLMRQQPVLRITPDTPLRVDYELHRRRPVLECTITGRLPDFPAGAGQVVELDGYGDPDGRYLVDEREWDPFTLEITNCTIARPHKQLPEPAHEVITQSSSDEDSAGVHLTGRLDESRVADFVREGERISKRDLPYAWGGGHDKVGQASKSIRPGENQIGFDCSGYISACAYKAGLWPSPWGLIGHGSGEFASSWGVAGEGKYLTIWANGGHVFAEVKVAGLSIRWVDTSRQAGGKAGPHVRYGNRSTAGFTPRHWPGT